MPVQRFGETPQNRLGAIGGYTFNDQLLACHPECNRRAILEQPFGAKRDRCGCWPERGMVARVHGVFV
jgi:hypothetical protein